MKKSQTLSIVLAVKNEERNIKKCLECIKWADEIIIIDNGSIDNTIKLAKRYTNKIYSFPKKMLIPELQTLGIKKATKDWILVLDADVIVPKETAEEIKEKIQNPGYDAYYLPHKCYYFGEYILNPKLGHYILKLFKNGKGYFSCTSTHCPIIISGKTGRLRNPLLHYAYPTISSFINKTDFYTSQDANLIFNKRGSGILNKKVNRIGLYNLLLEPFLFFQYTYLLKGLYKEGMHGLILSILQGYYLFLERAKVWELQFKLKTEIK